MKYLSVAETAAKWQISERSVRNYCAQGRVQGAVQAVQGAVQVFVAVVEVLVVIVVVAGHIK